MPIMYQSNKEKLRTKKYEKKENRLKLFQNK